MKKIGIIMFVSVLLLFCCIPFVNASSKEGGKALIENGETCCTPSEEQLRDMIRKIASELGIPDSVMTSKKVNAILEKYNNDLDDYLFYRDDRDPRYPHFLLSQKIKTDIECQLYLSLKNGIILNPKTNSEVNENARISNIINMLSEEKIFESYGYRRDGYDKTFVNVMQEMLNEPQQIRLIKCILTLKDCCDAEGIKSVLQSANINVLRTNIILYFEESVPENKERNGDYFIKRLELMTKYIQGVYNNFRGKYWIRSTGSDPHQEGQHALFLINKKTNKIDWVYKPHDMTADAAVLSQESMFVEVNKLIKEEFKQECKRLGLDLEGNYNALATMNINAKKHIEEFITKKSVMTPMQAQVYFFRLGILKAITDAMAVIDLHADNIMPTGQGPVIIDAEIDFFHYGAHSLLATGPINAAENINKDLNSAFFIKKGEKNYESSGIAFLNPQYHNMYDQSYSFMVEQMKLRQETFARKFEEQLKKVKKVRLLPLTTKDFSEKLQDILSGKGRDEIARKLVNDIKGELTKCDAKFLDNDIVRVNLNEFQLKQALLVTFENGTIPAMYADMEGNIYLDDTKVGEILKRSDGIKLEDTKLTTRDTIDIMKQCFEKVISSFKG